MQWKNWISTWVITILVIPLVGLFNYLIDPMEYNSAILTSLNKNKLRNDERIDKFNLIKSGGYDTYIFGSSKATVLDPDRIKKHTNNNSINTAFSSATIDEIEKYILWIIKHNKKTKNIIIAIDLFGFSNLFVSNGTMPREIDYRRASRLSEYLSLDMARKSLRTIEANLYGQKKTDDEYLRKGMRYYKDYLSLRSGEERNEYVRKNVTNVQPHWHVSSFSTDRIANLTRIIEISLKGNIRLELFTNPMTFQQIFFKRTFLRQLSLIESIVRSSPTVRLTDFNNFNKVNFDNNYFMDKSHYNYETANCIIDKLYTNESNCGKDFGYVVTAKNVDHYINHIKNEHSRYREIYGENVLH